MREFMLHGYAVWGVQGAWLLIVVGWYLIQRTREGEFNKLRTHLAKGIFIFFAFATALCWRIWWFLLPGTSNEVDWTMPTIMLGGSVGLICLSRVLSPPNWGAWRWWLPLGAATFAIALTASGILS